MYPRFLPQRKQRFVVRLMNFGVRRDRAITDFFAMWPIFKQKKLEKSLGFILSRGFRLVNKGFFEISLEKSNEKSPLGLCVISSRLLPF